MRHILINYNWSFQHNIYWKQLIKKPSYSRTSLIAKQKKKQTKVEQMSKEYD